MGLVTCFHWPNILMCAQWSLVEVEAWQCGWKQKKRWHEADRFSYMFDSKSNVLSSSLVQQLTHKMQYCWMTACQETGMGMISRWHQTCKLMLFKTKSSVIGLFDQFLDSLRTAIIYQNWFLDFWEPLYIYQNWFFETWILLGSLIHPATAELSITPLLWPFTLHPNPHKKAIVWCTKHSVASIPFCKTPMSGFPCMAGFPSSIVDYVIPFV
jgi:hypothetical protein